MANRSRRDDDEVTVVAGSMDAFTQMLNAVSETPQQDALWDQLEESVRETGKAEDVAARYREVLEQDLGAAVIGKLAERAVRFHDEWLDDVEAVVGILTRALQVDPTSEWAFDRVSLHLTVLARWDALLELYERAIGETGSEQRRITLLEEAAHIAKDCAGQIDRALKFLEQLFALNPSDAQVAGSLERLLKQQKRYRELIEFWTARLEVLPPAEALAVREQMAACWLHDLNDPNGALASIESLLHDPGSADAACILLEKILGSSNNDVPVRRSALNLLREHYDKAGRWTDVVRALRTALEFVDLDERVEIHGEITRRLVEHERDDDALDHLAALVVFDPVTWDDALLDKVLSGKFRSQVAGCKPKLGRDKGREVLHRAAELAAGDLNAPERAAHLYQKLLQDQPDDLEAIERLAGLYDNSGATRDLLELRKHELTLATEPSHRIELRLQLARLYGVVGDAEQRIAALRENLMEKADHQPSIEGLVDVLQTSGRFAEVAALLCEQAEPIEKLGGTQLAADLWARAAVVHEEKLHDLPRAVHCLERVVELAPSPGALDSLARIHSLLGDHASAVRRLEQRIELTEKGRRTNTIVRLVRAQMSAGHPEQALARVQQGLLEDPTSLEMRSLEADLHRAAGRWEDLARVLQDGAQWADDATRLTFLREAAEVYKTRLRAPERAVPVLEQASTLAPADRAIRAALADALRAAGRVPEARAMAEGLIQEFGRRRPPERAQLHALLAEILYAAGDQAEAIRQLESAASMDMTNPAVQRLLGDLYARTGQLDRAERAYQALLLILRRQKGHPKGELTVGMAETLLYLHRVSAGLGAADRAAENLESAFETASRDEAEARLFERALREGGDTELLLRALKIRLETTQELRARCEILVEMATALSKLDKGPEALEAWLGAIAELPGSPDLHEAARSLALRCKLVERYAEQLDRLADDAISHGEATLAADLLLRLGAVQEQDLQELDHAAKSYARAEDTGERLVDIWRALARVNEARGDRAAQMDALRRLSEAGKEALSPEERVEILYTLADLEMASSDLDAGLMTLSEAVEHAPLWDRAALTLRKALQGDPSHEGVLALFEKVARASLRDDLLLDALCRMSLTSRATQEMIQEAATVARRLHASEQYLAMLHRAVEIAADAGDERPALWALRMLSEHNRQAGDAAAAVQWMSRAAEVAEPAEARELRFRVAELAAGPAQNLELAAAMYERLLENDVTDTSIWNPLLDVVRRIGDRTRLSRLLSDAADAVFDPRDRSALRLERAKILLESGEQDADAMTVLRRILEEEPDHVEAAQLLCDLLQKNGDREELAAILTRQLDAARERGDANTGVTIAMRLGALLGSARHREAVDMYRSVLEWIPDHLALLRAVLGLLRVEEDAPERADILERLLKFEAGADAISLALELAHMREALGDVDGLERAVLHACNVDPANPDVKRELARFADRLERQAAESPDGGLQLLMKAASVYRERLGNAASAATTLQKAHALRPHDRQLLESLAGAMVDSGQPRGAVAAVSEAIDACAEGSPELIDLLRLRGTLWTACDEHDGAVVDLERALSLGGDQALPELHQALLRARRTAASRNDTLAERKATMRLPEVLTRMGNPEQARMILAEWVSRSSEDRDALQALLAMDIAAERWDDVAEGYGQLMDLEQGPALADAALKLADACEKAGRAQDARDALERVYQADPAHAAVRARLRRLYEHLQAHRELANLLLIDAKHAEESQRFELLKEAGRLRLHELRQPTAAIGPLSEALELKPTDHEATLLLADAYTVAGLVDEAAQMLDQAIGRHAGKRSRELASLQHRMARVAALGDRENELSWLYAAFDSNPQSGDIAAELADLAMELGHYEVALKALRAITSMKNPTAMTRPMAYLKQAKIAYQQGDERKAVFFAKKAQAEDADFLEAKEFLQVIGQGGG